MKRIIAFRHVAAVLFVRATVPGFENAPDLPAVMAEDIRGAQALNVVGNLPLHLASLCGRYRAIEMPEIGRDLNLRGVEVLTPEQMRNLGARVVEYVVLTAAERDQIEKAIDSDAGHLFMDPAVKRLSTRAREFKVRHWPNTPGV